MDERSVSRGYGRREGGRMDYVTKKEKKKGGRMKKRMKGGWWEKGWNREREREGGIEEAGKKGGRDGGKASEGREEKTDGWIKERAFGASILSSKRILRGFNPITFRSALWHKTPLHAQYLVNFYEQQEGLSFESIKSYPYMRLD